MIKNNNHEYGVPCIMYTIIAIKGDKEPYNYHKMSYIDVDENFGGSREILDFNKGRCYY